MGQKTNLVSLRFSKLPNFYSRLNYQEFIYIFSFLKYLNYLFLKNKLFLTDSLFFFFENKIFLKCFLFFRFSYLKIIQKELKKQSSKFKLKKKFLKKKFFNYKLNKNFNQIKNIFNSLKFFKNNIVIFTFINLNITLKKKKKNVKLFFEEFKKIALKVFPRRLRFFLEFIQLSILFLENKIKIKFFISIFCEIFRILTKKLHSKFFIFINQYFNFLITNPLKDKKNLLGIKFIINGKLKGKMRSNSYILSIGTVPIQSFKASIDFAKAHTFNRYGVFGLKIWVYKSTYVLKTFYNNYFKRLKFIKRNVNFFKYKKYKKKNKKYNNKLKNLIYK